VMVSVTQALFKKLAGTPFVLVQSCQQRRQSGLCQFYGGLTRLCFHISTSVTR